MQSRFSWCQRLLPLTRRMKMIPSNLFEEIGHDLKGLIALGKIQKAPVRVRHGLEYHELRVNAGTQQRTVKEGRLTEHQVPCSTHAKGRWKLRQIAKDRCEL